MNRPSIREIRLASGLVLLLFVATHLTNHALGLVSLDTMETGLGWFKLIWRNPIATALLYGALLVHFLLGLYALYSRRTLRMPPRELAQLILGLVLPFLLVQHVGGTRLGYTLSGNEPSYARVVYNLWVASPIAGLRQTIALLVAWSHACLGVYFWVRHRPWFPQYSTALYTLVLLVPLLALLGFAEAGKDLAVQGYRPLPRIEATLEHTLERALYFILGGLIAATFAARAIRRYWTRSTQIEVTYASGQVAFVPKGFSVLEASRSADIPHVAVCGGRGRCSTCRVRVLKGLEDQPGPTPKEQATLRRIKAADNVRLACQFRPVHPLTVVPVLSAGRQRLLESHSRSARGREHVSRSCFATSGPLPLSANGDCLLTSYLY